MNPAAQRPASTMTTLLDVFHDVTAPLLTTTAVEVIQAQGWTVQEVEGTVLIGGTGRSGRSEIQGFLNEDGTVGHLMVIVFSEPTNDASLEAAQDAFVMGVAEGTRRWGPPTRRLAGTDPEASWNFGQHNVGLARHDAIVTVDWTTEEYQQQLDAEIGQPDYLDEELD